MTYLDIIYTCFAFFIIGFLIVTLMLVFYRIRASIKRRSKSFSKPAKFVPDLNLQIDNVPESIDKSSASNNFKM